MRMSELSAASGVSVATIKYYLREGLLAPGASVRAKQADYSDGHLHRLRLIRALADLGDVPVADIRRVLAAIDDPTLSTHDVLGAAHRAVARQPDAVPWRELDGARASVDGFLERLGWRVSKEAPGRHELARALATLRRLGWEVDAGAFERYANVADDLASWELKRTPEHEDRQRTVEAIVVGTVVFEAVLNALRRLAQEHHSAIRFAEQPARPGAGRAKRTKQTAS